LADTLTGDLEIAGKELATAAEVAAERDRLAASLQQLDRTSAADLRNAEEKPRSARPPLRRPRPRNVPRWSALPAPKGKSRLFRAN
jgi:hypothetical protein